MVPYFENEESVAERLNYIASIGDLPRKREQQVTNRGESSCRTETRLLIDEGLHAKFSGAQRGHLARCCNHGAQCGMVPCSTESIDDAINLALAANSGVSVKTFYDKH